MPDPRSTYRLQLTPEFGFDAAAEVVPYLAALGISSVYTSPYLQAAPGSTHGYDVADPTRVNAELGGEEGRRRFVAAVRQHGLGHVIDIVPNHMAAHLSNPWWRDVIENGQSSRYARYFDVDWDATGGKVVLPVLSDEGTPPPDLPEGDNYELAHWREAPIKVNYRRFFNISDLVGLRQEDPEVFAATHRLILEWVANGEVDGLRVDHVDGLRDPARYLEQLHAAAPDTWVVVEKILEGDERLPAAWPVAGTTGYDALNVILRLFVDPAGEEPLTEFHGDFTGDGTRFDHVAREKKRFILHRHFEGDFDRISRHLAPELHAALADAVVALPVYRTYDRTEQDRRFVADTGVAPAVQELLLGEDDTAVRARQLTSAVMAKGVEDTAYYAYSRFTALNEVGGDPGRFGSTIEEFASWPWRESSMVATATHDTKRGEDVRARLALLSEIPTRWTAAVRRWAAHNAAHRVDGWPERSAEYLYYQTLVGSHPLSEDRAVEYMHKVIHEAKVHTSWIDPSAVYAEAVESFVRATLRDQGFMADLDAFVAPLVEPGRVNSLAQTLLKLTLPGVPDTYQGTELWDLSLVDPDNRRPVDYGERRRLLAELEGMSVEDVMKRSDEGLPKLLVTTRALHARPSGGFTRIEASGDKADHVVAFARASGSVTVVPRLVLGLGGGWGDTTIDLPGGARTDAFTGDTWSGRVALADLLERFPVALLG